MNIKNWLHKNTSNITIILLIALFSALYWQTTIYLPLFGDATIHGQHAKVVLENGWASLDADYPAFYYYFVNTIGSINGQKGYNISVYIGVILIILYCYLLAVKITKEKKIGILIAILVGFSSKLIFYSARLYQEVLITAFFIICLYYLYVCLNRQNLQKYIILLGFLIGITLSIKQQGLIILYTSILLFYTILFIIGKNSLKNLLIIAIIPLLIGAGYYGVLFHNKGRIIIGNEDYKIINIINYIGQDIFRYKGTDYKLNSLDHAINYSQKNKSRLSYEHESILGKIEHTRYSQGVAGAELRHIQFSDLFTDFIKFNDANNLYSTALGYQNYLGFRNLTFVLLVIGIFLVIGLSISGKGIPKIAQVLLFFIIFLGINYFLFQRNTDQSRYHLFIPFYLLIPIAVCIKKISKYKTLYLLIISMLFISIVNASFPFFEKNKGFERGQIYSPSKGGMASVIETGEWMNKNISNESIFFQTCGNETSFYSNRKNLSDWRVLFLTEENDLQRYFKKNNVTYVVIFQSQIINDLDWNNPCRVPRSFEKSIEQISTIVFKSEKQDITVYNLIK